MHVKSAMKQYNTPRIVQQNDISFPCSRYVKYCKKKQKKKKGNMFTGLHSITQTLLTDFVVTLLYL